MKKISLFIILLFVSIVTAYSQIYTKKYIKGVAFEENTNFKISKTNTIEKRMPLVNVSALLEEDEVVKNLGVPFRFGKGFEVDISLKDGKWTNTDSGNIWSLKVSSQGAYSINFIFDDLYLSEGSKLYIYNEDETIVYGPVNSKQNIDKGLFLTDLIQGESVFIHLFEPIKAKKNSRLGISKIIHAYKDMYKSLSTLKGTAESCNNNVDCYSNWDDESDGIALILLSSGTEHCTGSLVNNTANDYTPYILTAFHCVDSSHNYTLSNNEITNAENWLYKFNFKYPECGSSYTSITFNGAHYRSGWAGSDFALLEMHDSPVGNRNIKYLGWDKRNNTPTSGTSIHHPAGDYMKISFDDDPFNICTFTWGGSNNAHWLIDFDDGVVEKGSSGAPIFNQNSNIVGQLSGNSNYDGNEDFCDQPRAEYGKFDISWAGNATNTSRLSNWLDPNGTGASTTSLLQSPTISGSYLICYSGTTYTMRNPPSGVTVYWGGNNLVYPNGNTGTSVTVRAANSTTSAYSTITASFTINGNQFTFTNDVWVGQPQLDVNKYIYSNGVGENGFLCTSHAGNEFDISYFDDLCSCDNYEVKLTNIYNTQTIDQFYTSNGTGDLDYSSLSEGYYLFWARGHNDCGWGDWYENEIEFVDCSQMESMFYIEVFPNPTITETTIELKRYDKKEVAEDTEWEFEVFDMGQNLKAKSNKIRGKRHKILPQDWKRGIYIVRAKINDELITTKLIVDK